MPLTRQQIYRRRRITIFGSLIVVLAVAFYLPITLLAPLQTVSANTTEYVAPTSKAADPALPGFASSGIGAVGYPGLLASDGTTKAKPIASISKVISALVVLDAKPLASGKPGPVITFTDADVGYYNDALALNGQVSPVTPGMTMTEREVLTVTLVHSANNYAKSLVSWAFGSQDKFLVAAKAWLKKHGMTHTKLEDPTGLTPKNVSTPTDLVTLGKLALKNATVAKIISTKKTTVPYLGQIENTNQLLGIDGIDGIKTGTLDEAGACLLFSADTTVGGKKITLVGVVLGGPDHPTLDASVRKLLKSVEAGFHKVDLVKAGDSFADYSTAWGEDSSAVAARSASVVVWSDTPVTADITAHDVKVAKSGAEVGSVTFTAGDQTVEVPLLLDQALTDPGPWWRLTNPSELF